MGTRGFGPFDDDDAADFMGSVFDQLMQPVKEFLERPAIDRTFWKSYAGLASMNDLMEISESRPWSDGPVDPAPIVEAMRSCARTAIDNDEIDVELLDHLAPVLDQFSRHLAR